jgi:hypothetical protein
MSMYASREILEATPGIFIEISTYKISYYGVAWNAVDGTSTADSLSAM